MSHVRSATVTVTTTATGASTDYTTEMFNGHLDAISILATGTTSTADFVITGNGSGVPILTKANVTKASTSWFYPRQVSNKVADGAVASGVWMPPVTDETIKVATLGGGNAQKYVLTFYVT